MKSIRLKRMVASIRNGTWGGDPGTNDVDVPCVRAADFDFDSLSVDLSRAPVRGLDASTFASLRLIPGDIVVEKSGGGERVPVGRAVLFRTASPAITSNFAARVRAAPWVDSRFLTYVMRSLYDIGATRRCVKQTTGIQNLDTDAWLQTPAPAPPTDNQRRIAEFLDDRVARIDKIIAARRDQLDHLEAMTGSLFLDVLRARGLPAPTSVEAGWDRAPLPPGWRSTHLGRVLRQLTNGFVGPTRDILVDSGIPYIQSVHIKNGQIQFARRPFYVSADWHGARPRINLRAGDVLIVQTGDVGQVALVPERYGPASCHALLIARVHPKVISPAFLTEALRSSFGYQCMLSRATGALHPHLEAGVRSTPLVLPPLDEQDELVTRIAQRRATLQEGANYVRRSIDLLTEYKQSLITAAVTGELDVTTASKALLE